MWDFEHPYPEGPKVAVHGFPRALYPPDAASKGRKPSADGPDVEAYKRIVHRLGRWTGEPWNPAYTNQFAHGASSNVGETGVAGVQRQQHVDATGWLGPATFEMLRAVRVPAGLPDAGQPAMDAPAVALLDQAYALFGGHEPAPGAGTVRVAALARAATQIGTTETPPGSNDQRYGLWYGDNGVPWCAIFATWCYVNGAGDAKKPSTTFVKGSRYAYVPYIVGDARAHAHGLTTTDDPIPGDLVCYDWDSNGQYDHVGLFEKWIDASGSFSAIEGNTSESNNSNGGEVMRRTRVRSGQATVFVRVAEP